MNSDLRDITVNLSGSNIHDQIGALLYSFGLLENKDVIVEMNIPGIDPRKIYQIRVKIKKEVEVTKTNVKMAKKL